MRRAGRDVAWVLAPLMPVVLGPPWCLLLGGGSHARVGTLSGLLIVALLATAVIYDLLWRIIPNWLTYTTLGWALLLNGWASWDGAEGGPGGVGPAFLGAIGLGPSLLGALACFMVMLVVFALARGGAGDLKLATTVGGLIGPSQGLGAVAVGFVIAGVVMMSWLVWSRGLSAALRLIARSAGLPARWTSSGAEGRADWDRPVPMAVFLAIGTLYVLAPPGPVAS